MCNARILGQLVLRIRRRLRIQCECAPLERISGLCIRRVKTCLYRAALFHDLSLLSVSCFATPCARPSHTRCSRDWWRVNLLRRSAPRLALLALCVSVSSSGRCACVLVCLCACVLVCLCACVLVCLCACVLVCLCACVLVCLCACVLVCLCACVLVCLCACVLVCLCACVLVCLCVCVLSMSCLIYTFQQVEAKGGLQVLGRHADWQLSLYQGRRLNL